MKDNFTVIAVVLDRSGSMQRIRQATVDGFNEFLVAQKAIPGECKLYLVQFDHEYTVVNDMTPIENVSPLNDGTFRPRGNTALLYALGRTINDVGARLAALPESERPSKVIVVTITDGEENASVEFTRKQIFDMITHQKDVYSWEFMFLGANQDAIKEAAALGIAAGSTITYSANPYNTGFVYNSMASNVATYRKTGAAKSLSFTDQDRVNAVSVDDAARLQTEDKV